MALKVFICLGLVFALVLLVSSEVAASETSAVGNDLENVKTNGVEDSGYKYKYKCKYGKCCGKYGCKCCAYAGEAEVMKANGVEDHYYPKKCKYGKCCGKYGCKCCASAAEAEVMKTKAHVKPQN